MTHNIVGIAGSLREGSINRALLAHAGSLLPEGFTFNPVAIGDIPLYNDDLDAETIAPVARLREAIDTATGVLIVTPEYNYGIPGPLKNAIDWASRPAYASPFANRPVGILTASPGPYGGARVQQQLKQVLLGMAAHVYPYGDVAVGGATLDEDGRIALSDKLAPRVKRYVEGFAHFAAQASEMKL